MKHDININWFFMILVYSWSFQILNIIRGLSWDFILPLPTTFFSVQPNEQSCRCKHLPVYDTSVVQWKYCPLGFFIYCQSVHWWYWTRCVTYSIDFHVPMKLCLGDIPVTVCILAWDPAWRFFCGTAEHSRRSNTGVKRGAASSEHWLPLLQLLPLTEQKNIC